MPFLPPNQQRQSTEGTSPCINCWILSSTTQSWPLHQESCTGILARSTTDDDTVSGTTESLTQIPFPLFSCYWCWDWWNQHAQSAIGWNAMHTLHWNERWAANAATLNLCSVNRSHVQASNSCVRTAEVTRCYSRHFRSLQHHADSGVWLARYNLLAVFFTELPIRVHAKIASRIPCQISGLAIELSFSIYHYHYIKRSITNAISSSRWLLW